VRSAAAALHSGCTESARINAAYALAWLTGCTGSESNEAAVALCVELCNDKAVAAVGGRDRPTGYDGLLPPQRAAMHGLASASASTALEPLLSLIEPASRYIYAYLFDTYLLVV
jgi:hypothetical protein